MNKIFLFVLIAIAAVSVTGFWYWETGSYSKEVLKLEIIGPESVQAGEEIEYLVKFKNNGKARLEEPQLIFEYPKNSLVEEGKVQRVNQTLEAIYPGEERVISFKARLFGKEGDVLKAQCWLNYKPKNLKASYESTTSFVSKIGSVPLTLEFDLPLKAEQGDSLKFSINYFSNIDYLLDNLRLRVVYPDGFNFTGSQPQALDKAEWKLPALSQVDGGRVNIQGTIEGVSSQKKLFRAQLGIILNSEFVLLKETSQAVEMIEPSLYISQLINGSQNYVANIGDTLHYEIFFQNIGKKPIQKKFLLAKLEGDFFDLDSLRSEQGDVGKGDNSILWDWKEVPDLQFLDVDEEGTVEFWVKIKDRTEAHKIKNPVLKSIVSIGGTQKIFETKVNSKISLTQKASFEDEVFGNSGPNPPQVGSATTFTIVWQVKNSWNNLQNVKVKSVLPSNVKPTGKVFPEDGKFTFDSQSRELIWNIGELQPFQGDEGTPLSFVFQVELTPDVSQRGIMVPLIGETEILGEDVFTSDIVSEKVSRLEIEVVGE